MSEYQVDLDDFGGCSNSGLIYVFGINSELDFAFIGNVFQVLGNGLTDQVNAETVFGRPYHNAHFLPPGSGAGGKIRTVTIDKPTAC